MDPLGFSDRRLWLMLLERNGRATAVIGQFTYLPLLPDGQLLTGLMLVADRVCRGLGNSSAAFLLPRPGSAHVSAADWAWARQLTAAATPAGVAMWPLHIASDESVFLLASDDCSEPRGA
jgi:hypothetical protein